MANYAIMRIEKRKLGSVGRIGNHHERLKAEYKSNPDIDPSRTHQNYHIVEPPSKYRKAVLDRIEAVGVKRRKEKSEIFPVRRRLCCEPPESEQHTLTADGGLVCERGSEQSKTASSQGSLLCTDAPPSPANPR